MFKVGDRVKALTSSYVVEEGSILDIVEHVKGDAWITATQAEVNYINKDHLVYGFELVQEEGGLKEIISPLDKQISGTHYKDCAIQPIEYIHANGLDYFEGNAVKYITRHRKKNGKADLEKAIHYLELLIELEYKEE